MKAKKKTLREIAKDLEGTRRSTSPSDLADRIMAAIPAADREFYLRDLWMVAREAHGVVDIPVPVE